MNLNETPFLHGLADDLGVPAGDLRYSFLAAVTNAKTRATRDLTSDWTWTAGSAGATVAGTAKASGETGDGTYCLIPAGGSASFAGVTAQAGMFWVADGQSGINITVQGDGSDDDAAAMVEIYGVLPDSQTDKRTIQGSKLLHLPLVSIGSSVYVTVINPSSAAIVVYLDSMSIRSKSNVCAAGRDQLLAEGIPVGKAKNAFLGTIAAVAQASAEEASDIAVARAVAQTVGRPVDHIAAKQVARQKASQKVQRIFGRGMLHNGKALHNALSAADDVVQGIGKTLGIGKKNKGKGIFKVFRKK